MVFGLVLTPNKKYSQTVEKDYQLSNAALDTKTCGAEESQLMVTVDKNTFLLCTLSKEHSQHTLDLQLSKGQKIAFCSIGSGTIHLIGYMLPDMADEFDGEDSDASEEADEQVEVPQLVPIEGKKDKKAKEVVQEDSDEDSSDDEDFDLMGAEEESDEDDSGEEEQEEDDSDDSEEEPEPPQKKKMKTDAKQNGLENGEGQKKSKKELKQQKKQQKQEGQKENQQKAQDKGGKKKVMQGGVIVEDLKVGDGPEAKQAKKVAVYYEGRLKSNNKVFDSCKNGNGFKFTVGRGEVIRGWDVGVVGMKVGSKRRITCPPQMAYGSKGSPPVIPPNSTLVFEVELRHVKN